jgi:nucleoside-diphosphate-sugar epimerase
MVTIDELVNITARVAGKEIEKIHITDSNAVGVRGRNSCNDLIREKLGWDYEQSLEEGIRKTYEWIVDQDPNATEHAQLEDSLDYETSIFAG